MVQCSVLVPLQTGFIFVCCVVRSVCACHCMHMYVCTYVPQLQARLTVVEERLAMSKANEAAVTAKLAAAEAEVSDHIALDVRL